MTVQTPSMLLNQPWYWFAQTWPNPGIQSCGISAHNSLGEVAIVYFDLVVAPVGNTPSGGGTSGMAVYDPGNPSAPAPTGSSAGAGKPMGYFNPATGLTYTTPAGTDVCSNCRTDPGQQTNDTGNDPNSGAPSTGVGQ